MFLIKKWDFMLCLSCVIKNCHKSLSQSNTYFVLSSPLVCQDLMLARENILKPISVLLFIRLVLNQKWYWLNENPDLIFLSKCVKGHWWIFLYLFDKYIGLNINFEKVKVLVTSALTVKTFCVKWLKIPILCHF